jgi:hypothetical protein
MSRIYKGDLAKPIKREPLGPSDTPEQRAAWNEANEAEEKRRMDLLFEAHGIKAGDWESLCWSLAHDLRGFQLPSGKRPGRPKFWWDWPRAELRLDIEELQAAGLSVTEATQHLANVEPYKFLLSHANGAERLRSESTRQITPRIFELVRYLRDPMSFAGETTEEPEALARKLLDVNNAQDEPQNEQ